MGRVLLYTAVGALGAFVAVLALRSMDHWRGEEPPPNLELACQNAESRGLNALGLEVVSFVDHDRAAHNVATSARHGVLVNAVAPDSLAASIGLQRGDLILLLGSRRVDSVNDANEAYVFGQRTSLVFQRGELSHFAEIPAFRCPREEAARAEESLARRSP